MEKSIEEFVGIYKNAFSKQYCEDVINQFNSLQEQGFTKTRQELGDMEKHHKDDTALWSGNFYNDETSIIALQTQIGNKFTEVFWRDCYTHYAESFSALNELDKHAIWGNKVQRTNVGQGYHIWHCEQSSRDTANRLLFYIVYLNDVEEGGETEFLYQKKRYKPEQGTVIIAPAGFTHTHRGNPPYSNDKYIITGWVEY